MRKRRLLSPGLAVMNAILLGAVFALQPPTPALSAEEAGWRDCCEQSTEQGNFCCHNCCWFKHDCHNSAECMAVDPDPPEQHCPRSPYP